MNTSKSVVVLCFLLLVNVARSNEYLQIGLPVSQVFSLKQHGGSDQNWWLSQTADGLIYVGSGTGITQWDGEQWHKYASPNNSRIRSMASWRDGGVYVGTIDGIGRFIPDQFGRLHYQSLLENLPSEQRQFGEIWSVAASPQGVAFVSNKQVYLWNGSRLEVMPGVPGGKHRVFNIDGHFVYKLADDPALYEIHIADTGARYTIQKTKLTLPAEAYIRSVFYNLAGKLVVVTAQHGIFAQDGEQLSLQVAAQQFGAGVIIYNAIQASDGYYYVVTLYDGLFILNASLELVRQYTQQDNLSANTWYSVLEDQQGNIWLSGIPNVIKMVPPHRYSTFAIGDNSTIIDKLALVNQQVIAAGDGLFGLNPSAGNLAPAQFVSQVASKQINFDALEYQGYFLYAGSGGVFARPIHANTEQFVNILPTSWARSISVDPLSASLFVATYAGLYRLTHDQQQWHAQFIEHTEDELEFVAIEDNGVVWAGTPSQEVYRIENAQFADRVTEVRKFTVQDGLPPGNVMPFKLPFGVGIATSDGLMDFQADREPELQFITGLPAKFITKGKDVFRLYADKQARIWYRIAQDSGYIQQDEQGSWQDYNSLFKPFTDMGFKDFLSVADNSIWFAQSSGEVYRADIARTAQLPAPGQLAIRRITELNNDTVLYGGLLPVASLPVLDQYSNAIRIAYSLTQPGIKQNTMYRHRLAGSGHHDWSEWGRESQKDYTLLPGGDFRFELQARDQWGRIYQQHLDFVVKPPWYLTQLAWWVYSVLLLLMLSLSGWLTQRWRTKQLRQHNLTLEHTVSQRTQQLAVKVSELEQQKILKERFFNNVSHEFRTPLTLTIAPLQALLNEQQGLPQTVIYPLTTALNNAQNMLSLVGHILDINRLQTGQFPLHIAQYDVAELIRLVARRFSALADQQHQSLQVFNADEPLLLYCDRDQLDKCLTNLLANALKYSGERSDIGITLLTEQTQIGIQVADNGAGIASEELSHIFERYYQGTSAESVSQPGTGIGLALVKELIELHHGRVEVSSVVGQGCCFTLWLQRGKHHFAEIDWDDTELGDTETSSPLEATHAELNKPVDLPPSLSLDSKDDVTTVLVVDDNLELRQFIALRLAGYYRIVQASNGQEGLEKALSLLPDIIISDVMMPKMNGLEMASALKSHPTTSTIPLILLSAKAAKRDTVAGLQTGADDYLTKPFDTSELVARVDGLIKSRKLIRQKLQTEFSHSDSDLINTKAFASELRQQVLAHLTDSGFSIDHLAQAMAMSRRTLGRKCQQECQQSVGQFITETRMQMALKLIKQNKLSLSEIAYGTGYESLSYFSRTFKKFYGQAPSTIE